MFNHFREGPARPRALHLFDRISVRKDWTFVEASAGSITHGLALYRARPDKTWSLTDCISFTIMSDRGIKRALAYDHHFEQAGFEALLRRDPP